MDRRLIEPPSGPPKCSVWHGRHWWERETHGWRCRQCQVTVVDEMKMEPLSNPDDEPEHIRRQRERMRRLVEADQYDHDAPLGRNGGRACDVTRGPCACGAWHFG